MKKMIAPVDYAMAARELLSRDTPENVVAELLKKLEEANNDPLTGLKNRRAGEVVLTAMAARSNREQFPYVVIIFDLDHFKRINDTLGHTAGDAVLRAVSAAIKNLTRADEAAIRWGGEEFVVGVHTPMVATGAAIAERYRKAIEELDIIHDGQKIPVTASFGVALAMPREPSLDAITRADAALYDAKRAGRNCVKVASSPQAFVGPPRPANANEPPLSSPASAAPR